MINSTIQAHHSEQTAHNQVPAYVNVNAYSHSPSSEQIFTIILFLAIIVMHSVFIVSAITTFNSPILWILLGITYGLFLIMAFDYISLTCQDPVDDLLLGVKISYKLQEIVYCLHCKTEVHRSSYHCKTCDRCVQHFDHHCRYLNNCIGGKNYHQFLRLLIVVTVFCITIIGEGIWIFVASFNNSEFKQSIISNWAVLVAIILTLVAMVAVDTLLVFHLYLTCVLKKTTFEYLMEKTDSQEEVPNHVLSQQQIRGAM